MIQLASDRTAEDVIIAETRLVAVWFFCYESIPCDHGRAEVAAFDKEFCEDVKVIAVETSENPIFTEEMLIDSVPTLLFFKAADEIARFEGPYSREMLGHRFKKIRNNHA